MRPAILVFLLAISVGYLNAQVVFWSDNFENSCGSNCLANGYNGGSGAWSVTTANPDEGCGPPDYPNVWYVSCAENGNVAGACGTGCVSDESLHLGSTSMGDGGAAYDAGGYCPWLGWPGTQSDTRANSPIIDCSGRSNITLSFVYMEFGNTTNDDGTVWYFNGSVWAQLSNPAKTACCGGACNGTRQGRWTAYSIVLPASADNNPNVRIGFRWVNNDDGTGYDPSFAIDDVQLSVATPMPVSLISFQGNCSDNQVTLQWKTASESNNNYFEIETSTDGVQFETIGKVEGAGNSNIEHNYTFSYFSLAESRFFRLRQVDYDGVFSVLPTVFVSCNTIENLQSTQAFYNNLDNQIEFQQLPINCNIHVFVSNIEGKAIDNFKIKSTDGQYKWRSSHPLSGVLLVSLITFDEVRTIKLVVN